ncbi:unnamed protein product [Lathyrus sativus]|nr:unnamed protein product [Lathyrus sativus]
MSRLDRFLVSGVLIDRWGIVGQLTDKKEISNHCLIWIMNNKEDWSPKPLRILDYWFDSKELIGFVEKELKSLQVEGRRVYMLKKKFKILKGSHRMWNAKVFHKINLEVKDENKVELNFIDALLVSYKEDQLKGLVEVRHSRNDRHSEI